MICGNGRKVRLKEGTLHKGKGEGTSPNMTGGGVERTVAGEISIRISKEREEERGGCT